MRVMMSRGCAPTGPCSNISYGEVEDYTIVVSGNSTRGSLIGSGVSEDDAAAALTATQASGNGAGAGDGQGSGLELEKVYPVPTADVLNVDFLSAAAGKVRVQVFAANGSIVLDQEREVIADHNTFMLDVSQMSKGTYFVKIHNGSESFTEKFVKQ